MKCDKKWMSLYAVTDRTWLEGRSFFSQVEEALSAGITCLQLREKKLDRSIFLKEAKELKFICKRYHVPFIVNDDVEIAIESQADGVHIGQKDIAVSLARQKIGPNQLLGVSVQTVAQAVKAQREGADYLGVGAVFPTETKIDADYVSYDTLKDICAAVNIPVVAIGGINLGNIVKLAGSGVDGVAVVSAIFAAKDIKIAVEELRKTISKELNI